MNTPIAKVEFKRKFGAFLEKVVFKQARLIITRRGRPVAQISSVDDKPDHPQKFKGSLTNSDPLFEIIDAIVADRRKHTPRVSRAKPVRFRGKITSLYE